MLRCKIQRILSFGAATIAILLVLPETAGAAAPNNPAPSLTTRSATERQNFHEKMLSVPHGHGCFVAHYGDPQWHQVKCGHAPKTPNPMARGPKPYYVGGGTDYFSQPGGLITSATGSFDAVTNVTAESGPTYSTPSVAHPNVYSLQMNANTFSTPSCSGAANCLGWQQFLYSQSQCNGGACIFIEYWLLNHTSPCPAGQGWLYYAGTPTTVPGCYLNTAFKDVPVQALKDLAGLRLSGSVSGNTDNVSLSVANGDVYLASNPSVAGLGQGWQTVEYNLVGDCCDLGAYFTAGPATIQVRISTVNGTQNPPNCLTQATGDTAETNNLNLTGPCIKTGGAQPSISFTESGGGPLPPAITQGDTHLITINGTHYNLQETGEYILVQAGTDLIVEARQDYLGASRAVSWNVGLAVQMGRDLIILYPGTNMVVNLTPTQLTDGGSISLDAGVMVSRHGSLFTISRPGGDIVQASALGDHIDATVQLGAAEAKQAQGLLVSKNGNLVRRDGALLRNNLTAASLQDFVESWRVEPARSLFPAEGRPAVSGLNAPKASATPSKAAQEMARKACSAAGVTNAILLKDCILDVAVTGKVALADAYVHSPRPKRDTTLH